MNIRYPKLIIGYSHTILDIYPTKILNLLDLYEYVLYIKYIIIYILQFHNL